ncbi:hypothetical protein [Clostridium sporogenes]|uniref:hypothetical protein n=1 Tax=Clostridium sporogenes TaxID=1509 RepID=UPI002237C8DB|nr:hypothetical protein [Clostridium sporogenes]MCW6091347.1 hypothetical protein [Clostridium sporogenes]
MKFELTVNTFPESEEYLKIIYKNKKYKLNDFASEFQDEEDIFFLDRLLESCKIEYNGEIITYEQMCQEARKLDKSLYTPRIYSSRIYPIEKRIFIIDKDYYAAGKLIKSAEEQIKLGRYSLIKACNIIDFNINNNWKAGYTANYVQRAIYANNAIMWYNNVFDSIMQVIFFAFEIYKKHPKYNSKDGFHKTLKLCNYAFLSDYYGKYKHVPNFSKLWSIISGAQKINENINKWANYIKHKGGLKYKGLEAKEPIEMIEKKGIDIIKDTEFEAFEVSLDDVIKELKNSHKKLCESINKLVNFMNFESVDYINKDNKLALPQKSIYKKVLF